MQIQAIAKEQIPFELLRHAEVLDTAGAQLVRKHQLQKAVHHNRLFYSKARIVFETIEGRKEVSSNIWEITDNNVMLKGGISIPVCCILEVVQESESFS